MDRFEWSTIQLPDHEEFVDRVEGIKLADGGDKASYHDGFFILTNHRLIWARMQDAKECISLRLGLIEKITEESTTFSRSVKMVLHLLPKEANSRGPVARSQHSHIRIGFDSGGQNEFTRKLRLTHTKRLVEDKNKTVAASAPKGVGRHVGIAGIENKMKQQHKHTDQSISVAFKDLDALIVKAKDMVGLSKSIASKLEQKKGAITDDETIQFKSYLLSLGIPDPVTRMGHHSGSTYLIQLAKQTAATLEKPLIDCGGTMTLTDVYCRINRARGMELLSPKDLLDACDLMESLNLPVILRIYDTGVKVVQLRSQSDDTVVQDTALLVTQHGCLSAEGLARELGISMVLAKERLLLAESKGKLCRDDSVEGLKFYFNRFLDEV